MIRRILKCVKGYTLQTILTPVFMLGEVAAEMIIPTIMSEKILNHIISVQNGACELSYPHLLLWGLVLILCGCFSFTCGTLSGVFGARASAGFAANLREKLYFKVQDFSFANIDKFQTSSLVTRLTTDVTNVQNAFMMIIRVAVRSPLMMIFSIFFATRLYPEVGIIYAIALPVLVVGLIILGSISMPTFNRIFKKYDALNESVQENVKGMRVVKSYVREDFEKKKFAKSSEDVRKAFTKAERIMAFGNPLMMGTMYVALLVIVLICAKAGFAGDLYIVDKLQSLISYSMAALSSLMMLSFVFVMITMSFASVKRINEVLVEESDIVNPENPVMQVEDGSIDFNNVGFKYDIKAEKYALADIDLHIKSGETIGIIGGTGSSKTTLVNLISRLYDATTGEVKVAGRNVKEYDLDTLRNNVSVVLQKNLLFSGTVYENIRWGNKDASDEEVQEVCKLACADEFVLAHPDGYNRFIEQGGANVSGGQKQRLCIARALLKKPKILILDDSTSAVDTKTDAIIRNSFKTAIPNTTKIIIAQRVASVKDADRIIVMNNGTIDGIGTHDELLENNSIYREVYYTQNSEEADKRGGVR